MFSLLLTALISCSDQDLRLVQGAPPAVPYAVDHWTIRDGLPQGEVTDMVQDSEGTLWVSTFGGLVSFDGVTFRKIPVESRALLGDNRVTSLAQRAAGGIWIGMESGALLALERGKVTQCLERNEGRGQIRCILEDASGSVWLGSPEGLGVFSQGDYCRVDGVLGPVMQIVNGAAGSTWCASDSGLWKFPAGGELAAERVGDGSYPSLARTADGCIWAANTKNRLLEEWRPGAVTPVLHRLAGRRVFRLAVNQDDRLWFSDQRLFVPGANGLEQPFFRTEFALMPVRDLLQDHEGNYWIGGLSGLLRIQPSPLQGFALDPDLTGPLRMAAPLGGSEDRALALNYNGKVLVFDGERYELAKSKGARSILPLQGDRVLLGRREVCTADWASGKLVERFFEHAIPQTAGIIFAMMRDAQGQLWCGTEAGELWLYPNVDGNGVPEPILLAAQGLGSVLFLMEDDAGDTWVGARFGVLRISDGRVAERWSASSDFRGMEVRAIHQGSDRTIWLGTYGSGMYYLDGDRRFQSVTEAQGLHEDVISRILPDDFGNLVLLGNRAVSRVSYADLMAVTRGELDRVYPQVYNEGPGIQTFEGNGGGMLGGWKARDGAVWFPAREGLVRFDSAVLGDSLPPPPVRILSAEMDGMPVALESGVELAPGERNLVFRFTASTFVDPKRARFRYLLEGYDEDWAEVGEERKASYTRVPPGRYTFRVIACNRDGAWSESEAALEMVLRPRFVETRAFELLLAGAAILALLSSWLWRGRSARARAMRLESEVRERTAELEISREMLEERVEVRTQQLYEDMDKRMRLEEQLRRNQRVESIGRLAGGLAHDFNNYLMVVMAESDSAMFLLEQETSSTEDLVRCMDGIRDVSLRASKLTRQLLAYSRQQVLKPEYLGLCSVVDGMRDMIRRLVPVEIEVSFDLALGEDTVLVDVSQLEQVLINLVLNSSEAIHGSGVIEIAVEQRRDEEQAQALKHPVQKWVVLLVRDTGSGMDEVTQANLFDPFYTTKDSGSGLGLASVHGIVEQSGGFIELKSELGVGTCFAIWFPASQSLPLTQDTAPAKPQKRAGRRVLVCDDQEAVGRVTANMLRTLGYEPEVYVDPEAALAATRREGKAFDALVTDLVMPGMTGRELVEVIREESPELPVLYISGYLQDTLDSSADLDAQTRFLAKPFQLSTLNETLQGMLAS